MDGVKTGITAMESKYDPSYAGPSISYEIESYKNGEYDGSFTRNESYENGMYKSTLNEEKEKVLNFKK